MSRPLSPNDPAYFLLEQGRNDPSKRSKVEVYKQGCHICEDPEFALMGLPLCYPCAQSTVDGNVQCGGHIAADDTICDTCGTCQQELLEKKTSH